MQTPAILSQLRLLCSLFRQQGLKMADEEETHNDEGESEALPGTGVYVTEIGPCDVLLGRGTGPSMHQGNIRFREAVEDLKPAYVSTPSRKSKKSLVEKVVNAIKAKNGRFLYKLKRSEMRMRGLGEGATYEVVQDSVAVEKTKQAIRYVHYKKEPAASKRSIKQQQQESIRVLGSNAGVNSNLVESRKGLTMPSSGPNGSIGALFAAGSSNMMKETNPQLRGVPQGGELRILPTTQNGGIQQEWGYNRQSLVSHSSNFQDMLNRMQYSANQGSSSIDVGNKFQNGGYSGTGTTTGGGGASVVGNLFPTPMHPSLDGILLNKQLSALFSSNNGGMIPQAQAQAGRTQQQLVNQIGMMPALPPAHLLSTQRAIFQGGGVSNGNFSNGGSTLDATTATSSLDSLGAPPSAIQELLSFLTGTAPPGNNTADPRLIAEAAGFGMAGGAISNSNGDSNASSITTRNNSQAHEQNHHEDFSAGAGQENQLFANGGSAQLQAFLQAEDDRRRIIDQYLSSLPPR